MNLPVYKHLHVKSNSMDELQILLGQELNLIHPVVIHLETLSPDDQREFVGLIENHFVNNQISHKFPYPVYIVTDQESTISGLSLVKSIQQLPKFFAQRDGKMNVKESHLISRNKLFQQEVRNSDSVARETELKIFGNVHRQIHELESERGFYRGIMDKLIKAKPRG